jgi:phosphatidylethanolamine/phosphatidyl-N-methylethanolamine N-methyltransferase
MENNAVVSTYRRLTPAYDLVFGPVLGPGRRRAIQKLNLKAGDRVLELGVGTGLTLPLYPDKVEVTGVDLSPSMLRKARRRAKKLGLGHVQLAPMDAMALNLPDAAFDKVLALYVASVVPDPLRLLREMRRVCRPGGDLLLVNHFSSDSRFLRRMERLLRPLGRGLSFHTDLALPPLLQAADLEHATVEKVNAFGYWRLVHAVN